MSEKHLIKVDIKGPTDLGREEMQSQEEQKTGKGAMRTQFGRTKSQGKVFPKDVEGFQRGGKGHQKIPKKHRRRFDACDMCDVT
jgi:hypothetical protein